MEEFIIICISICVIVAGVTIFTWISEKRKRKKKPSTPTIVESSTPTFVEPPQEIFVLSKREAQEYKQTAHDRNIQEIAEIKLSSEFQQNMSLLYKEIAQWATSDKDACICYICAEAPEYSAYWKFSYHMWDQCSAHKWKEKNYIIATCSSLREEGYKVEYKYAPLGGHPRHQLVISWREE